MSTVVDAVVACAKESAMVCVVVVLVFPMASVESPLASMRTMIRIEMDLFFIQSPLELP